MPTARYAPIPNNNNEELSNAAEREMEDAFDGSDDEEVESAESRPMISRPAQPPPINTTGHNSRGSVYNFEYDFPPPGSPPSPSSRAHPDNMFQNTNGYIPVGPVIPPLPRQNWFSRNLGNIWPGRGRRNADVENGQGRHVVGNGLMNDGVFANVVAKPQASNTQQNASRANEGSSVHIVPEFEDKDAPPSYAVAQADAAPPYWDNSILAPSTGDELLVEGLPPGGVFSFVTNFIVSLSFEFVGFMMTSVLATSHAAKYGSRAGLGFTFVRYGFSLRARDPNDIPMAEPMVWHTADGNFQTSPPIAEATGIPTNDIPSLSTGDYVIPAEVAAATDWLSFFLMTVGWLLFLSSVLGYWRVKRFERTMQQTSRPAQSAERAVPMPIRSIFELPILHPIHARSSSMGDVSNSLSHLDPVARQRRLEEIRAQDAHLENELRAAGLL